jgi:hypothetical protein
MAEIIFNEVLCFVNCHFGSVPNDSISVVLSTFYTEEDRVSESEIRDSRCMCKAYSGCAA